MTEELKNDITQKNGDGFIKVTDSPVSSLTAEQKAIINRKGNVLFNQGDIDSAKRLFVTTGYSDGLIRVGDTELKQNNDLKALKFYWLAHNKRKAEPIIQKVAALISLLLNEKD